MRLSARPSACLSVCLCGLSDRLSVAIWLPACLSVTVYEKKTNAFKNYLNNIPEGELYAVLYGESVFAYDKPEGLSKIIVIRSKANTR